MTTKPFVATLQKELIEKLRRDLEEQGFEFSTPPYTLFAAKKKNLSVILYTSLKLTVQGKEMAPFIEYYLEPEILKEFLFTHPNAGKEVDLRARIGIDEAGKGDFFGPLCVAGVYADGKDIENLVALNVRDSKEISDKEILTLCEQLKKSVQHEIIRISPERYNTLYTQFGNLNSFLAWGHATAIENLVKRTGCQAVVIDRFAHEYVVENAVRKKKLEIKLEQKVRAESDVVVAAASILARGAFLDGMKKLSDDFGMQIPKGASSKVIVAGKELVRKFGPSVLAKVSKTHFRTTQDVLSC